MARFVGLNGTNAARRGVIPLSSGILILGSSGIAASVTTGTAETQLASITIPAGVMGANGSVRVSTNWSYTNSGNNKTLRVRFGGSGGTVYMTLVPTTTATMRSIIQVFNAGATNAQASAGTSPAIGTASSGGAITSSVDTAAATTVYISGQTASSGETITLLGYTVELIPGV